MLVPAAVVVLFSLAAIAVDLSLVFLAERELAEAAQAAANDAAALLDEGRFRASGEVAIDCAAAPSVAAASFAAHRSSWMADAHLEVAACGPDQVVVVASGRVAHVFGRALPGAPHATDVDASAVAVPVVGA